MPFFLAILFNHLLFIVHNAMEELKPIAFYVLLDIFYIQCLLDLAENAKMAKFLMKFMIVLTVILIVKLANYKI